MEIRNALLDDLDDLDDITAIYHDVLMHSTAIYSNQPVTTEDRIAWWRARAAQNFHPGRDRRTTRNRPGNVWRLSRVAGLPVHGGGDDPHRFFERVACLSEVGDKFDRFLDLVLLQ